MRAACASKRPHGGLGSGVAAAALACGVLAAEPARADTPPWAIPSEHRVATAKTPYSIPWQLRGVLILNSARLDTSAARYEDSQARIGTAIVSNVSGQFKVPRTGRSGEGLGIVARVALASDAAPAGRTATLVSNPFGGAVFGLGHGPIHGSVSGGATVPIGGGGGNSPSARMVDARRDASGTRMAMDGALFSANDLALVGGLDVAYIDYGLTIQLEATIFHLIRERGEAAQPEATKTNLTSGLHAGYFFAEWFSLSGDFRYQRWLNAPFAVDAAPASIDQASFSVGPRFHVRLGNVAWLRPGLAYGRGLDRPLAASTPNFHVLQLDVPVVFQ